MSYSNKTININIEEHRVRYYCIEKALTKITYLHFVETNLFVNIIIIITSGFNQLIIKNMAEA